MALALRFQDLLAQGSVRNHAQLAELGRVSRVRVSQILMLTNLAPTIQETLVFLPKAVRGRDHITERSLREPEPRKRYRCGHPPSCSRPARVTWKRWFLRSESHVVAGSNSCLFP